VGGRVSVLVNPLVLLVDDCQDTREMYAEVLSPSFDVVQASTGQEALLKASEHRPSAIVMDMMLPDLNGKDAIASLRRNPRTQSIPVVVVSGFSEPALESPPWDAYLVKPCRPDALITCLARLIEENPRTD
jgi:CheY-like chemotaxis protein